jgi:hypothetical protein
MHFTEDVTGDVLDCGDTTYTVVSGETAIVLHEGTSASGNTNFTGTVTPRNVVLPDAADKNAIIRGLGRYEFLCETRCRVWIRRLHPKFVVQHRQDPAQARGVAQQDSW